MAITFYIQDSHLSSKHLRITHSGHFIQDFIIVVIANTNKFIDTKQKNFRLILKLFLFKTFKLLSMTMAFKEPSNDCTWDIYKKTRETNPNNVRNVHETSAEIDKYVSMVLSLKLHRASFKLICLLLISIQFGLKSFLIIATVGQVNCLCWLVFFFSSSFFVDLNFCVGKSIHWFTATFEI